MSSSSTSYGSPEVQVDGARVDRREGALGLDEAEQLAGLGLDDREAVRRGRAQRHLGRPGSPARAGSQRPPRLRSSPGGDQAVGVGLEAGAEDLGVVRLERRLVGGGAAGGACRCSRRCGRGSPPRRAGRGTPPGGGRRTGRARRRRRRTCARPPRSRRPARPHCWRRLATVPGNVTEIAASRWPMSMPSSSALVATTPSSSPLARRRSISRRCCGV